MVTVDFFAAIGLKLVEGRLFPDDLRADGPHYGIINESLARQCWPGESALGKRIGNATGLDREWAEIVGVVRDVGFVASLGVPDTRLQVYHPLVQEPWGHLSIALRASRPETLVEPLRRAVPELDPDLPVVDVHTVGQAVVSAQHNFRLANQLLAGFAGLGLLLSAIGLYGVVSTLAVQRTAEFCIRFALGAPTRAVLWLVLGKSLWLTAIGSALGLGGASSLVHVLGQLMPGLPGGDPFILVGIVLLLLSVALLACYLPAAPRRSIRWSRCGRSEDGTRSLSRNSPRSPVFFLPST